VLVFDNLVIFVYNHAMIEREKYPATRWCGEQKIARYKEHVNPLNIKAKGDVLIIGAGVDMEEIGVIEQEIVKGEINNICLIGGECFIMLDGLLSMLPNNYPKISNKRSTYQNFFVDNPNVNFDTIMFLGTHSLHNETVTELASHLNKEGKLYFTVNYIAEEEVPTQIKVANCKVNVLPSIPSNPNYNWVPNYYGVVVEKTMT
jgi:hypothetical protein